MPQSTSENDSDFPLPVREEEFVEVNLGEETGLSVCVYQATYPEDFQLIDTHFPIGQTDASVSYARVPAMIGDLAGFALVLKWISGLSNISTVLQMIRSFTKRGRAVEVSFRLAEQSAKVFLSDQLSGREFHLHKGHEFIDDPRRDPYYKFFFIYRDEQGTLYKVQVRSDGEPIGFEELPT